MTHLANTLDYSSLSQPVTATDIATAKGLLHPDDQRRSTQRTRFGYIAAIALIILGATVLFTAFLNPGNSSISLGVWMVIGGLVLVFALISAASESKRLARMSRFALANGLTYLQTSPERTRTGMIFNRGHTRIVDQALLFPNDTEIGNYQYTTGSGKHRVTHYWGYVRIMLPRRLPHMVLDAKKNNFLSIASNLPTGFSRSQVLSLEGDFDKYFTLYAPDTYKTDALYIFTPDVMATLIDMGQAYDIEIIDDSLLLYTKTRPSLDSQVQLEALFSIIDTISSDVRHQGGRYYDARSASNADATGETHRQSALHASSAGNRNIRPNIVATPGRRLRTRPTIAAVAAIALVVAWVILIVLA